MTAVNAFMNVQELAARLASGSLSSVALVELYLDRIAALDIRMHAFVATYADEARQAAQSADLARRAGYVLGPLHGIPIAIKDLIEIEGQITTGGSEAFRERRSTVTARIVQRLREQGMIILGKTHTVEFATGGWGTNTRLGTPLNPWDLDVPRTPGGSSSGSGVAVAAGLAPWAIGTDTGGSVRLPGSWCNLTSLKVCEGRISIEGVLPLSTTLDTPGPMARCAADARLLYHVLKERDGPAPATVAENAQRPRTNLDGLRLARLPQHERTPATPDVLQAYDASLEVLRDAGAEIVDIELPYGFAEVAEFNSLIMNAEGYSFYGELLDDPAQPLDEDVRARLINGRDTRAADYLNALRRRERMQRELVSVFDHVDALLTPTTATPPLPIHEVDQKTTPAYYTRFANFFNLAALALPNGATPAGLPISLQIIGRPYSEELVLDIGEVYQRRTNWHLRTPNLPDAFAQ
ncbi:amidase [Bordetella sp. 15P40C-2]|uniref:amidase n=1 Tax=Bordetella sp. 15P40C-2 TaxID=2572246 RepID=UPI001327BBBB|nr:amidase [Bordetella sp. 15P40C-2]MVW72333.1 amidase [Bordetella sp. 15P40C-2]